jgi:nucleotide-binding universal stress UspA family protein
MKIKFSKALGNAVVQTAGPDGVRSPLRLKKILVPIDFSARSHKAMQYAVAFAKQFHASIVALNVVPIQFPCCAGDGVEHSENLSPEYLENVRRQLAVLVQANAPAGTPTRAEVRHGDELIEILTAAKELAVDIIIVSTRDRTGRAHSLAGSIAGDVARLAPCPVLVVRQHEHEFLDNQTHPFSAVA